MRRNTVVFFIILFVLAVLGWAGWANFEYRKQAAEARMESMAQGVLVADSPSGQPELVSPLTGKPAPAFTLQDLSGKKVSLADYKGNAVLINFWATWCAPCKVETPWLIELRNKYASQGFEVLGISSDDLDADNKQKLTEEKQEIALTANLLHVPYPVLLNGDSISNAYGGVDALPSSFFVNRDGVVVAVQLGLTSKDEIEKNIQKALGK